MLLFPGDLHSLEGLNSSEYLLPNSPSQCWSISTFSYQNLCSLLLRRFWSIYSQKKFVEVVHCSGGAQTKVLHFVDNVHVIKDNLFPVPAV
jgi:hypothetical protein